MRNVLAALSLAILVPAAARAQEEPSRSPVTVAVRAGIAFPAGSSYAEAGHAFALSEGFGMQIPVQIEGAVRLSDRAAVGAYGSYGFDRLGHEVKAACAAAGSSCSASTIRLGVQGSWALSPIREGVVPWLGLGVGWEWTSYSSGPLTETFGGPEIASLQGGTDWRAGRNLSVGFYLQLALGRFWRLEQSVPRPIGSTTIELDARFHAWLGLGVRGTVRL